MIDLTTGEVQEEVLVVTEGVRHLEVDAGGAYLLVTDSAAGVRWATVTGEAASSLDGGFLAADW